MNPASSTRLPVGKTRNDITIFIYLHPLVIRGLLSIVRFFRPGGPGCGVGTGRRVSPSALYSNQIGPNVPRMAKTLKKPWMIEGTPETVGSGDFLVTFSSRKK
jgi:hypothetical protein